MKKMLCALIGTVLLFPALALATDPPSPQTPTSGSVVGAVQRKLDLNRATLTELVGVPGIGPSTAEAIVEMRTKRGAFSNLEELIDVKGIGPKKLATLSAYLTVTQPTPATTSSTGTTR